MAKPAAASEAEVEVKPKGPMVKIILAVVGLVILISGTMVGTLFISGFFSQPKPSADQAAGEEAEHGKPEADAKAAKKPDAAPAKPDAAKKPDAAPAKPEADAKAGKKPEAGPGDKPKLSKKSPDSPRFEYTYHQLTKDFLVNLTGSRKVMSVQIAVMTRYDERVIENVKKHEFALRSVVMDVMRQTSEADLTKPDFRKDLAIRIRDAINSLIEKYEDFGGIEDIYFTSFIVQ
jgi:flagellar FliL protein